MAIELKALDVKRIVSPGLHAVGGIAGLQLQVKPSGARSWVLRTMVGSKRRDFGLGGYPDVSLSSARERAREYKQLIRDGVDPLARRRSLQAELLAEATRRITFEEAAKRCHATRRAEFSSSRHSQNWITSLERYTYPILGDLDVDQIEVAHVSKALEQIWLEKTDTARRVRQRVEAVLSWATVSGHRSGENPARWRGNLEHVLPAPNKVHKVTHHAALNWKDMPVFMSELRKREGQGARALEFLILTAARSGDVRFATWDEIEDGLWIISAERMKAGRAHTVPLSEPALKLLGNRERSSELIFPSPSGKPLSDMTVSAVTKRMGIAAVPHGFRSSFKDWARNETNFADEVSELALAHVNSDSTRSAYARDELLTQRREMMEQWAEFLGK